VGWLGQKVKGDGVCIKGKVLSAVAMALSSARSQRGTTIHAQKSGNLGM